MRKLGVLTLNWCRSVILVIFLWRVIQKICVIFYVNKSVSTDVSFLAKVLVHILYSVFFLYYLKSSALSCAVQHCPTLFCTAMRCHAVPTLACTGLRCPVPHWHALSSNVLNFLSLALTFLHTFTCLNCPALSCTVLNKSALPCTVLQVLKKPALSCTILHCSGLSCSVLHFPALFCTFMH